MNSPDELETRLSRAMHSEADATTVSPDALVRIRGRIAPQRSRAATGWFRPAAVASAMAFTLVVGTLVGVRIAGHGGGDTLAEPPSVRFDAAATGAPAGTDSKRSTGPAASHEPEHLPGFAPDPTPQPTATAPADPLGTLTAPRTHKIPEDTGGSYVAILGPDSGVVTGRTVELHGQARTFEANVVIEVTQNGKVVKRDFTTASAGAPDLGTWTKVLTLAPGAYRIDAFEESAKGDGSRVASDTIWISVGDSAQDAPTAAAGEGAAPGGEPGTTAEAPAEPRTGPGAGAATPGTVAPHA